MVVTSSATVRRVPRLRRPGYPGRWSAKKHREQQWDPDERGQGSQLPYTWLGVTDRLLCYEVGAEQRWSRRHEGPGGRRATVRTPLDIGNEESRQALAAVTPRTGELLRSAGEGAAPVKGSNWTLGEVGAHMAVALVAFTLAVQDETNVLVPYIPPTSNFADRLRAVTSNTLALEPQREPGALADVIERRAEEFLSATAGCPGEKPLPRRGTANAPT